MDRLWEREREGRGTELTDDEIVMDGYWRQDARREGRKEGRAMIGSGPAGMAGGRASGRGLGRAQFQIKLFLP